MFQGTTFHEQKGCVGLSETGLLEEEESSPCLCFCQSESFFFAYEPILKALKVEREKGISKRGRKNA